jgi:hypothetical protein
VGGTVDSQRWHDHRLQDSISAYRHDYLEEFRTHSESHDRRHGNGSNPRSQLPIQGVSEDCSGLQRLHCSSVEGYASAVMLVPLGQRCSGRGCR